MPSNAAQSLALSTATAVPRKYQHGPHFLNAEQVEFRLWAPDAQKVELLLGETGAQLMEAQGDGWYGSTRAANAGELYRFQINGEQTVPDPASRFQPDGVHGASELIAPHASAVQSWKGRPWREAVIYELHIGTFSRTGGYAGLEAHLDTLADLGITAIELMPIATFEGQHGWGYDGVLPYAPTPAYGRPEELHQLVAAAHARGIMVMLDVVYNHFGPSGNYLHAYAQKFFTEQYQTPWGAAIDFEQQRAVRDFFIDNAVYWIEEFNLDGLRFDAVHAIEDASDEHFITELGTAIRARLPQDRHVHLILENAKNEAGFLGRKRHAAGADMPTQFTAQWNDDIHHALHVLLTGDTGGYYADYADKPLQRLARCLSEGFDYQGEYSAHEGKPRGEPSKHLPPSAFIACLQNHDQVGNRAMGERMAVLATPEKLQLGLAILLLSPQPPMLFMGEEWGSKTPFLYFCDFDGDLGEAVCEGRRKEFKSFPEFASEAARAHIPDPTAVETFEKSKLDWKEREQPFHAQTLALVRNLLQKRAEFIAPLLASGWQSNEVKSSEAYLDVRWHFSAGTLQLLANFSDTTQSPNVLPGKTLWGVEDTTLAPSPLAPSQCRWILSMKDAS